MATTVAVREAPGRPARRQGTAAVDPATAGAISAPATAGATRVAATAITGSARQGLLAQAAAARPDYRAAARPGCRAAAPPDSRAAVRPGSMVAVPLKRLARGQGRATATAGVRTAAASPVPPSMATDRTTMCRRRS